jgi:hypothetical protein
VRLRQNVTLSACHSTAHGWAATGTAHNPTAKPVKYTITVFFTTAAATVIGTGVAHLKVEPGRTADWAVSPRLRGPANTLCVLRGVG